MSTGSQGAIKHQRPPPRMLRAQGYSRKFPKASHQIRKFYRLWGYGKCGCCRCLCQEQRTAELCADPEEVYEYQTFHQGKLRCWWWLKRRNVSWNMGPNTYCRSVFIISITAFAGYKQGRLSTLHISYLLGLNGSFRDAIYTTCKHVWLILNFIYMITASSRMCSVLHRKVYCDWCHFCNSQNTERSQVFGLILSFNFCFKFRTILSLQTLALCLKQSIPIPPVSSR